MLIAAIDTSTSRGSVALARGPEVVAELRLTSEGSHSVRLLPGLQTLLEGIGAGVADVEGYAVTTGPGSFTGLRVGLASVQGLALARDRPCLGLSTLDVLAARFSGLATHLVPVMDAFRGELYAAVYDRQARPLSEPRAASPEQLGEELPRDVAFFGDGVASRRAELERIRPEAVFPERSLYLAGTLARLAAGPLARGEGRPAAALRPLYVRPPTIRKPAP